MVVAQEEINKRKEKVDEQLMATNKARNPSQEARHSATNAMTEATEALKMLRIIQQAIEALPDKVERIDELSALEEDLNFIESKLEKAEITQRIGSLQNKNDEIRGSLSSFKASVETLDSRKENLKEIYNKIPEACPYRSQRTEDMRQGSETLNQETHDRNQQPNIRFPTSSPRF